MFWIHLLILRASFLSALNIHLAQHPSRTPRHGVKKNFFVKGDVDLSDGGTLKFTPHEAHTRDKAPSNVVGFLERVIVRSKINDVEQSRFWSVGHLVAKTLTSSLSWKTEVCVATFHGNTVPKDAVMPTCMKFRVRSQR